MRHHPRDFDLGPASGGDPLGSSLARAAFDACAEGLLLLDRDGFVTAMNSSFSELYGLELDESVGQHYTYFAKDLEVIRRGEEIGPESFITQSALEGVAVPGVLQTIRNRRTGREIVARCSGRPFFEDGEVAAAIITVEDVTESTVARQQVEAALFAAEVGTWRADLLNGRIYGDSNFGQLYGLTPDEARGGPLSRTYELIHPDDRERVVEELKRTASSGEAHEIEHRVVTPTGVRWLLSRGQAQFDADGKPVQRVGSIVDVTRFKTAEEALLMETMRYEAVLAAERAVSSADATYATLIHAVVEEAQRLTGADGACLEIRDGDEMVYDAACGLAARFVGLRIPHKGSLSGLTLSTSVAARCDDCETDERVDRDACRRIGIRAMALVPLRYDQHSFGVLKVMAIRPHAFSPGDSQALALLGGFLGATVGRARASQALRESELQYRQIAEAIPQIVWTTRPDGYHDFFSQRWYQYTGMESGEDIGWDWQKFLHPGDVERTLELWSHALKTGEPYEVENRYKAADGEYRWFLVQALPIRDEGGNVVRWFGTLTDIQDQKEAEAVLERRVQERTVQLEAARRSQESWNYSVSHDLRAPLRAIMSTSRILQMDHADELSEDGRTLLDRQAAAAKRLGNLIDELLQTSRLASQDLKMEALDLSAIARETAEEHIANLGKLFDVRIVGDMRGVGDPHLVKLVYSNFLENAMKYSPGGTVIEVGSRRDTNETAYFVKDQGIGFDMRYVDKVWRPFERLVLDKEYAGTGIGLYNVASMVERMGGRTWAESEPGKGSTFWFSLPQAVSFSGRQSAAA